MRAFALLALFSVAVAITGCGSGAHDALRNEAEVMYHVPAYPAPDAEDEADEVTYVQPAYRPAYRVVPPDCDQLVHRGDGYYDCVRY